MTDKQIICKCNDKECGQCSFEEQLKAKEQECEELAYENYELNELFDRLKAENDGLKIQIKNHNDDMFKNPPEKRFYCKGCTLPYVSKKLKQTITEIKEIIKFNKANRLSGGADISIEQILQKISEVEDG